MTSAMSLQSSGRTFDESISLGIVCTSMSTLRRRSEGNSSYIPPKSKGTSAPVAASVCMPIVPPV